MPAPHFIALHPVFPARRSGKPADCCPPAVEGRRRVRAFTLVEVLVVIAILAVLISMLLPSLNAARRAAVRTECLSQMRQIALGMQFYANDNRDWFPSRNESGTNTIGAGYPHETRRTSNYRYDLNVTFIIPYVGGFHQIKKIDRAFLNQGTNTAPYLGYRNKVMFCPGQLDRVNPAVNPGAFLENFCSYEYHVYPQGAYWKPPFVNLSRRSKVKGNAPLWSCLTATDATPARLITNAHDRWNRRTEKPKGLNTALSDGSAQWVPWSEVEEFWAFNTTVTYWPKYRKP